MTIKRIGIIVAMDKEFAQLRTLLDDAREEQNHHKTFVIGQMDGREIIMQQCGIGKVNSAIGTVEMINLYHPNLIISTGCAGGADVSLNPLDVVVASSCVYHDAYCGDNVTYGQVMGMPERYDAPHELVDRALSVTMPEGQQIKAGLTVSGDWFVDSREKMREVLGHFPEAEAVDMESCSIAQTCFVYQTPFISFRIISDVPLKDTKAAQYFDFWDRMAEGSFEVTRHFLHALIHHDHE
ncbi:MAG: 5'-methylthioadenosine/S-adenosylhomocysteine nucleosidase [Prevotella sp.]|jgi:adenosylhomocysteine nucleosidase|nr:5'-methylthioadenosine/S-adenosylhomocysteine nucleosidase [Prevotella sp.]